MPVPNVSRRRVSLAALAICAALVNFASASADTQSSTREEFSAFAVNMGTAFGLPSRTQSAVLQITIERWSTDAERQELITAFTEKGSDGGRRILIATDRPIGFREARDQPRTIDCPFTLIEMRLDKDDKGEGKMSLATKIAVSRDKQHIELENYSTEPVRLTSIERRR